MSVLINGINTFSQFCLKDGRKRNPYNNIRLNRESVFAWQFKKKYVEDILFSPKTLKG